MSLECLGERPTPHGPCRQALEQVLSLTYQKLRATAHQKLPMDMLVLEDEKHHGAANLALQKVKVSGRRSQCLCSGDKPGSMALLLLGPRTPWKHISNAACMSTPTPDLLTQNLHMYRPQRSPEKGEPYDRHQSGSKGLREAVCADRRDLLADERNPVSRPLCGG